MYDSHAETKTACQRSSVAIIGGATVVRLWRFNWLPHRDLCASLCMSRVQSLGAGLHIQRLIRIIG